MKTTKEKTSVSPRSQCYEATREWAIATQRFSKKTDEGYWTPAGEFLPVPAKIIRIRQIRCMRDPGWRVAIKTEKGIRWKTFRDFRYEDDYKKSLAAAIAWLQQYTEQLLLQPWRHFYPRESAAKKRSTGHVGISWCQRKTKTGHTLFLIVTCGRNNIKTIRVGAEEQVGSHAYREKLKEAKTLRKLLMEDYRRRHAASNGQEKDHVHSAP